MSENAAAIELRAPAKINLSFRILARRADGFHEIETLMAPVSLFDEIRLEQQSASSGIEFLCDDPTLPAGEDNLVVRAARAFLGAAGIETGLRIELRKRIPHGAGLGGGSSDAATVLLGLSRFFEPQLTRDTTNALAAALGSDVPFFLHEQVAFCRGRGEIVEPAELQRPLHLLLLKPAFGVPTPWAYSRWAHAEALPEISYGPQEWAGLQLVNDLERPVFEKFVFLARVKMWLLEQPEVEAALMSGSGSTMFAVLHNPAGAALLAERARTELDPELWVHACEVL